MRAERVELVKQIHRPLRGGRVENRPQLTGGLAQILAEQAVKADGEQRQAQLVCDHRGRHRFARSGRAFQQ